MMIDRWFINEIKRHAVERQQVGLCGTVWREVRHGGNGVNIWLSQKIIFKIGKI